MACLLDGEGTYQRNFIGMDLFFYYWVEKNIVKLKKNLKLCRKINFKMKTKANAG